MKNLLKRPISLIAVLSIVFLSWNELNKSKTTFRSSSENYNDVLSSLTEAEDNALNDENYWDKFNSNSNYHPPAEDVTSIDTKSAMERYLPQMQTNVGSNCHSHSWYISDDIGRTTHVANGVNAKAW